METNGAMGLDVTHSGRLEKGSGNVANLTGEERSALEDQIRCEEILVRKYKTYAAMAADPTVKLKFERFAKKPQNHYMRLLGHLHGKEAYHTDFPSAFALPSEADNLSVPRDDFLSVPKDEHGGKDQKRPI